MKILLHLCRQKTRAASREGRTEASAQQLNVQDFVQSPNLIGAGLLRADDPKYELERTKIRVTPLLGNIQTALDLSLTFLATIDHYRSMAVEPLFGKP
jgi:hypothetical protein